MFNGLEGVFSSNQYLEQNEQCLVCSLQGVKLEFDPRYTLQQLREYLVADTKIFKTISDPSLISRAADGTQKFLYMTGFLSGITSVNLPKPLGELIQDGEIILLTTQPEERKYSELGTTSWLSTSKKIPNFHHCMVVLLLIRLLK